MGPRNAVPGGGDACEHRHWGLRWSSLWGHETLSWAGETHASAASGALGGAPYGATNRLRGVPKWGVAHMRAVPLGPYVELPIVPRNVCGVCQNGV